MNLFRQPAVFSEEDLIAFHMGELPERRARLLRRTLASDAALAAESASVAATLSLFKEVPVPALDAAVLDRAWQGLRPALSAHLVGAVPGRRSPRPAFRLPLLATGVAAIVAVTVVAVHHHAAVTAAASSAARGAAEQGVGRAAMASAPATSAADPQPAVVPMYSSAITHGAPHHTVAAPFSATPRLVSRRSSAIFIPAATDSLAALDFLPLATATPPILPPSGTSPFTPVPMPASAGRTVAARKHHFFSGSDLMLGGGGTVTLPHNPPDASSHYAHTAASSSISAMAAFHQQFHPALGYRVAVVYTRPDFTYSYYTVGNPVEVGETRASVYEIAGTYVVQGPHRGRVSTSFDAGAALLALLPSDGIRGDHVYRTAAVVGVNADVALSHHWGLRAVYRAHFYKSPDFRYVGVPLPVTTTSILDNAPSVGLTYRFGTIN